MTTNPVTPTNSPEALGAAVLAARHKLGLTQPQLALAAGVGVRFIVELEAGKPTVRLETLLKVLNARLPPSATRTGRQPSSGRLGLIWHATSKSGCKARKLALCRKSMAG